MKLDSGLPALTPTTTVTTQVEKIEAVAVLDAVWLKVNQEGVQALSVKLAAMLKAKAQTASGNRAHLAPRLLGCRGVQKAV